MSAASYSPTIPCWALIGPILKPDSHGNEGWSPVFIKDRFQCVYCHNNLLPDFDGLYVSATDHIVPQCAFAGTDLSFNHQGNLAASCATCNNLKGEFMSPAADLAWNDREAYLEIVRAHIRQQRERQLRIYTDILSRSSVQTLFPLPDWCQQRVKPEPAH